MTCSPIGEGNIMAAPVVAFHTPYFGPAATLIAAMRVPSGDQARLETGIAASSCEACSTRSSWRLKGSQIWSPPPESPTARCVPSGDQATTIGHTFRFSGPAFRCSWRIRSLPWDQSEAFSSVGTFQMRTRLPVQALFQVLATYVLCGDQAIDQVPAFESGPERLVSS